MIYSIVVIALIIVGAYYLITSREVFGAEPRGKRLERMKQSAHYKDRQFQNLSYTPSIAEGTALSGFNKGSFLAKKKSNITRGMLYPSAMDGV